MAKFAKSLILFIFSHI